MRNELTPSLNSYETKNFDESWLWHLRYGNLYFGDLYLLQKKQMVKRLPNIQKPMSSCESYILAKHHRQKFVSRISYRARDQLEIVHTDLCGPMKTPSLVGKVYLLTFIDDYIRKTWIYLLKQKSKAFFVSKRFKAMVEKESGNHIKILSSDRGGEYMLIDFIKFCQSHGIKR